jgi:carbonic anhydrase
LMDNWLRNIKDLYERNKSELETIENEEERLNRLCELNVRSQVLNVCHTTLVQNAWKRGQELSVHGWIYSISDGLLRDLGLCISSEQELEQIYRLR